MNSIKNYFQSPIKSTPPIMDEIQESNLITDSNLIISNMKFVIKSDKKKRKKKSKNKIENEGEISDISNILSNSLCFVSPNNSWQENNTNQIDDTTNCVDEFIIKIDEKIIIESDNESEIISTPVNAFQMMMTARNRIIGSNSPNNSKNSSQNDSELTISPENSDKKLKTKRKRSLEKWAEKKGSKEKQRLEDAHEEYVNSKMAERAERLKNLLTKGKTKKQDKKEKVKEVKKVYRKRDSFIAEDSNDETFNPETKKSKKTNKSKKIKPVSKRVKRLSSTESIQENTPKSVDDDFINKLSSPIKKKDSLLGYFPKLNESPPILTVEKNRSDDDPESLFDVSVIVEEEKENLNNEENNPTPILNDRPRRACSTKKSYRFDDSPDKKQKRREKRILSHSPSNSSDSCCSTTKPKIKQSKKIKVIDEIIDCDSIASVISKPVKLAPLFVKTIPKPAVDPEVLKARQEFLMSGIPEQLKIEIERQKVHDDSYDINFNYFPLISHVAQSNKLIFENDLHVGFKLKPETEYNSETIVCNKKLLLGSITDCCDDDFNILTIHCTPEKKNRKKSKSEIKLNQIPKQHLIELVKILKNKYSNFPVYRCFKQLKQKKTNRENLFTEIYKPTFSNEFLMNIQQVEDFKQFLLNWNNIGVTGSSNNLNESIDDFETNMSTNNDDSNLSITTNFMVLHGPNGTGKTNAVFALANELNFKVLEINSGSKRTGKKLLQELHEATQSHHVRGKKNNNMDSNCLLKKNINESNKIIKYDDDSSSNNNNENGKNKLALILIEDSDIVFDQDDGFINAINQLISTSKRPVILIANNSNTNHLLKLITQNSVEFNKSCSSNITKWLSILALTENCFIDYDELLKLVKLNNNDIRKTVLELQFFIQSGGDGANTSTINKKINKIKDEMIEREKIDIESDESSRFSWFDEINETKTHKTYSKAKKSIPLHRKIFDLFNKNQNISMKIDYPINFNTFWFNTSKIVKQSFNSPKKNNHKVESTISDKMLDFYENVSRSIVLGREKHVDYDFSNDLSVDIVHTIVEGSVELLAPDFNDYDSLQNYDYEKKEFLYNHLFTSATTNSKLPSVAMDYESYLRSICRIERDRRNQSDRRSSRFYHYLRNSINLSTFSTDIFEKYSNILDC